MVVAAMAVVALVVGEMDLAAAAARAPGTLAVSAERRASRMRWRKEVVSAAGRRGAAAAATRWWQRPSGCHVQHSAF